MIAAQKIANEARKPFTAPGAKIIPQNQTAHLGTTVAIGAAGDSHEGNGSFGQRRVAAKNPNELTEEEQVYHSPAKGERGADNADAAESLSQVKRRPSFNQGVNNTSARARQTLKLAVNKLSEMKDLEVIRGSDSRGHTFAAEKSVERTTQFSAQLKGTRDTMLFNPEKEGYRRAESIQRLRRGIAQWSNMQNSIKGIENPSKMIEEHNKAHMVLWTQCAETPKFRVQLVQNREDVRKQMYESPAASARIGKTAFGSPAKEPGGRPLRLMESQSGKNVLPDNMVQVKNVEAAVETDVVEEEEEAEEGSQRDIPRDVWLIHPSHPTKTKWDIYVGVLIFYSVVSVPFRIGFDIEANPTDDPFFYYFDWLVDFTFAIDIVLTFYTAAFNLDGDLIAEPTRIKLKYLCSTGFWIDFLSTMPWQIVLTNLGPIARSTKLLRVLRMARLLKLARLFKLSKFMGGEEADMPINPSVLSLAKMLFQLLFIAHILGCIWHSIFVNNDPYDTRSSPNWVSLAGLYETDANGTVKTEWVENTDEASDHFGEFEERIKYVSISLQYANSIYWAFTTMTTVGYGDINTANDTERIYAIFGMLVGATVFGYVIGNVTVMMENIDMQSAFYREKMDRVKEYLRDRRFPVVTAKRIRKQFKYFYKKTSVFDQSSDIVSGLPQAVACEVLYKQYDDLILTCSFLREAPPVFTCQIVDKMRPFYIDPGEFLFYEGEVGTAMFFINRGSIKLYVHHPAKGRNVSFANVEDDTELGVDAVMNHRPHSYSALCTIHSDLYFLAKEELIFVLELYPDVQARLEAKDHALNRQAVEARNRGISRTIATVATDREVQDYVKAHVDEEEQEVA
eukprot:CAMPEP_0182569816 /NCGR_PEP_ID=MMETSP1324-20130603/10330_1 /TAXON_ID=236786 /ORGANISM="Florenciella sp., Strain RCC1587" /LENGTH=848 /DNA_ID=CAMNT_0024784137 /DNA_START=99 /DNA_END=2642 /DNA_ORIENTATION=-